MCCADRAEDAGAPAAAGAVPKRQLKGAASPPRQGAGVCVGPQVREEWAPGEGTALLPHLATSPRAGGAPPHIAPSAPPPGLRPGLGSARRPWQAGAPAALPAVAVRGRRGPARGASFAPSPPPGRPSLRRPTPGDFTREINSPKSHEIPWQEGATRRGSGKKPTCQLLFSAGGAAARGRGQRPPPARRRLMPGGSRAEGPGVGRATPQAPLAWPGALLP